MSECRVIFRFGFVVIGIVALAQSQGNDQVLFNFGCPLKGAFPQAGVIRDAAGNLYGTTQYGGTANAGVVFKVDPAGHESVLHSFTGGADGANPVDGVIRDAAGNLYGITPHGGAANVGVVFKVDTSGREAILHSFAGGADGADPVGALTRDDGGSLYGTTHSGGTSNAGVIFRIDVAGHETLLYSFTGRDDGRYPGAGLVRDMSGNFYGTTLNGGRAGEGVVYKLDTTGHEVVLFNFGSAHNGNHPLGLIRDSDGNLYGTTQWGGTGRHGVVYRLTSSGQLIVLYNFRRSPAMNRPNSGVILDSAGNLYGTSMGSSTGWGGVYKLDSTGHLTILHSFTNAADGGLPVGGVALDPAGNLFGAATQGGKVGFGVVYKIDTIGREMVVYSFIGGPSGSIPKSGVASDSAGVLYGTTLRGGAANQGVVYKLESSGQKVLHAFTGGSDGGTPYSRVILDTTGNVYGTTIRGGAFRHGVVYKVDTTGNETVLYSFTGRADGGEPISGVRIDAAG